MDITASELQYIVEESTKRLMAEGFWGDLKHRLKNIGFTEGTPNKISEVLKANGWNAFKVEVNTDNEKVFRIGWISMIGRDHLSYEELIEDINIFLEHNNKGWIASGMESDGEQGELLKFTRR